MKKKYFFFEKLSTSKLSVLFVLFSFFISSAQVTTNSGSGLAANYPDLATAITALNGATITSPVVITLTGNETAPAGGYSITAQGDATNTIIVEGVTSTITANAALTVGALNDALFKLVGADYVTIRNFTMQENVANTVSATGATNNMTEWGIALLYLTATNGAQNNTIQGNTITLDRTYRNTFGIYSNSTHTESAVTASASATGAAGSNTGLSVLSNNISNINLGIAVVGPTAAADYNQSLTIGGAGFANTITNFGTNVQLSGYVNVSGTGYGILVRNTVNFDVSYNTITSSNGGYTSTTAFRGIFVTAFSVAPAGTFNQVINNNTISLRPGASAPITGIEVAATTGSATTNLSISNNDFNTTTHTVAATSAIIFINGLMVNLNTTISNNTFTNLSVNTSGSVTLISNNVSRPLGGVRTISDNRIVGSFTKTTAGGTMFCFTAADFAPAGTSFIANNNNFSNIVLTGATAFTGWNSNDGNTATDGPTKVFSNNTFSNLSLGSNGSTIAFFGFGGNSTTQISNNLISNVAAAGTVIGINMAGSNTSVNAYQNTISGITTTGTTINAAQIGSGNVSFTRNKIVNIESNNAAGVVNGLTISAGLAANSHLIANNIIGDLRAPITSSATDAIKGVNITSTSATTTNNIFNNSIYLAANSSGVNFSTSGVFHTYNATATTSVLDLRNNIIINNSIANGTGNVVALRRTAATDLNNFATISNNNDLVGPNIYADGTNLDVTLGAYQTRVAGRENASISVAPNFLSLVSSNANFLHIDFSIPTFIESGATSNGSVTNDFDGDIRQGVGGYTGTGSAPDIGADEFEGIPSTPPCAGTPAASNSLSSVPSICSGANFNLSLSIAYTELNYSYQWQSSPDGIAPYTNIIGQMASTATISQTAPTFYQCVITCTNSGLFSTSTPVQVTMSSLFTCYCVSTYTSGAGSGDQITNVTLGTLNNNSGASLTPFYTFFNAVTVPDLDQGSNQSVSISFGPDANQYSGVWIDYNQDGDFLDAGEFVGNNTISAGASGTTLIPFTVPLTATLGQTMMRVRGGNDAVLANTPCGVSSSPWGETEDYIVNITPCIAPSISTHPVSQSVCESTNVTLSVIAAGTGLTYQWKKEGLDILTATSASYTITGALVADSGNYTVLVTGACGTSLSNVAVVTVTANSSLPTEVVSACDTYTWSANGTVYTTSGIYTSTTSCVTRTLDLTITPSSSLPTEVVSECDTYTWAANGTVYTTSGIYTSTTSCVTRTLDLTITPSSSLPTEVVSACDTYTWAANGTVYTTSGIYTSTTSCVTRTLDLTITTSSSLPTEVVSACDTYTWSANGTVYTTSGIYTSTTSCVTRTLDLTITTSSSLPTEVVSACDTYTWSANGTVYTSSGIYTSTTSCVTRTLDLTITIATISGATTQIINGGIASDVTIEDIVVTSNGTVTWFASSADATANINPLPAGTQLVDGNIYYGVTNIGSCRSATLSVTVTVVLGHSSFDLSQLNYYPNPVKDIFNVKYNKEIISVDVYDLTGRKVIEMKPNTLDVQLNMTNLSNTMYIVRLQTVDGITELKVYKN